MIFEHLLIKHEKYNLLAHVCFSCSILWYYKCTSHQNLHYEQTTYVVILDVHLVTEGPVFKIWQYPQQVRVARFI